MFLSINASLCSKQTSKALVCPFLFVLIYYYNFMTTPRYCAHCGKEYLWKTQKPLFRWTPSFICTYCNEKTYITFSKMSKAIHIGIVMLFLVLFIYYLTFEWKIILPWLLFLLPFFDLMRNQKIEKLYFTNSLWRQEIIKNNTRTEINNRELLEISKPSNSKLNKTLSQIIKIWCFITIFIVIWILFWA